MVKLGDFASKCLLVRAKFHDLGRILVRECRKVEILADEFVRAGIIENVSNYRWERDSVPHICGEGKPGVADFSIGGSRRSRDCVGRSG